VFELSHGTRKNREKNDAVTKGLFERPQRHFQNVVCDISPPYNFSLAQNVTFSPMDFLYHIAATFHSWRKCNIYFFPFIVTFRPAVIVCPTVTLHLFITAMSMSTVE
jgi:hypothetical protein